MRGLSLDNNSIACGSETNEMMGGAWMCGWVWVREWAWVGMGVWAGVGAWVGVGGGGRG